MGEHNEKKEVGFEGVMQREQAVSYLEDLIRTIKEGTLHIDSAGQSITLHPADVVTVKVEGSTKDDKEKFAIKISWRKNLTGDENPALTITARAPEPAPGEEPVVASGENGEH